MIEDQKLTAGHAKILVGLENASFVANTIVEKKLSVRQSENFVKMFKIKKNKLIKTKDANIEFLEKSIIEKIGLNVLIKNKKNNSGKLIIDYKDLDQLNNLIELIKKYY